MRLVFFVVTIGVSFVGTNNLADVFFLPVSLRKLFGAINKNKVIRKVDGYFFIFIPGY